LPRAIPATLGGTSAGLAMLGEYLYGAMDGGSIRSPEALADPLGAAVTIEGDFLHLERLHGVVTDSHFRERERLGRLFAFIAKAEHMAGEPRRALLGLGIDESAALAVETDGSSRVYATDPEGAAWVVRGGFARSLAPGQGADLLEVARDGFLPGPLPHQRAVLGQAPSVGVEEVLTITAEGQFGVPHEGALRQLDLDAMRAGDRGIRRRMVVDLVTDRLEVAFLAPRVARAVLVGRARDGGPRLRIAFDGGDLAVA